VIPCTALTESLCAKGRGSGVFALLLSNRLAIFDLASGDIDYELAQLVGVTWSLEMLFGPVIAG
jgi:hypothetical protein